MENKILKKSIKNISHIKSLINKENLEKLEKLHLKYNNIIVKVRIKNSIPYFYNLRDVLKYKNFKIIENYFNNILKNVKNNGIIYFHFERYPNTIPIEEMINLPLFTFSINLKLVKNNSISNIILLPSNYALDRNNDNLKKDNLDFNLKINKAIWRFSTANPDRHRKRIDLIKNHSSNLIDIKSVSKCKFTEKINENLKSENFRLNIDEMRKYKILLECDGWDSIFWKLNSNSIVVKFNSDFNTITFIDQYLKENKHYINGDKLINNLEENLKNILFESEKNKIDKYKKMIKKSNSLSKSFNEKFLIKYSTNLIDYYFNIVQSL